MDAARDHARTLSNVPERPTRSPAADDQIATLFELIFDGDESGGTDEANRCAHCTHGLRSGHTLGERLVCRPERGMNCHALVTIYQHPMPCPSCRSTLIGLAVMAERLHDHR